MIVLKGLAGTTKPPFDSLRKRFDGMSISPTWDGGPGHFDA